MRVIRSWPEVIPPRRNYVTDNLERFVMKDYTYRGLAELRDDVLVVEWDMAISQEDLTRFIQIIREEPGRVLVAPYRLYQATSKDVTYRAPMWAMRRYQDEERSTRFVTEDDATCHLWGLGVTYLPAAVISGFEESWPGHFNDTSLSGWHYRNIERETRIAWDVRPVHLHYPIERIGR